MPFILTLCGICVWAFLLCAGCITPPPGAPALTKQQALDATHSTLHVVWTRTGPGNTTQAAMDGKTCHLYAADPFEQDTHYMDLQAVAAVQWCLLQGAGPDPSPHPTAQLVLWHPGTQAQLEASNSAIYDEGPEPGLRGFYWRKYRLVEESNGKDPCHVFTTDRTQHGSLLHEIKHCFDGDWHQ